MTNPKSEFTGVWIPKYILENKDLKPVDRLIYAEISCFEICTMSNQTLGERAGCSEDTASRSVGRLKSKGYVKAVGFDGRVRKIQSLHIAPPQNAEAATAKTHSLPPQNKAQDNNIDNKQITNITNVMGETPEHGNSDINEMFSEWERVVGYKIQSKLQQNRYACSNLLKKHGRERLLRLLDGVAIASQDKYAPRISDFTTLQAKLNDLLAWGKKRSQTKGTIKV